MFTHKAPYSSTSSACTYNTIAQSLLRYKLPVDYRQPNQTVAVRFERG